MALAAIHPLRPRPEMESAQGVKPSVLRHCQIASATLLAPGKAIGDGLLMSFLREVTALRRRGDSPGKMLTRHSVSRLAWGTGA